MAFRDYKDDVVCTVCDPLYIFCSTDLCSWDGILGTANVRCDVARRNWKIWSLNAWVEASVLVNHWAMGIDAPGDHYGIGHFVPPNMGMRLI